MVLTDYPNLFQFPLNIALVDDDEDYLNRIKQTIMPNTVATYTKPQHVIDALIPFNVKVKTLMSEYVTNEFSLNYKK